MSKGLAIDFGSCGFGWSTKPPSLRLGFVAFYVFNNGVGVVVLGYRASLRLEKDQKVSRNG